MSKIARLFVHRLERIARREAQRNAHRNGLLQMTIVEIGGHAMRRYAPAFDTSRLSGDRDQDLAWLRRNFGGYLLQPPEPSNTVVTDGRPPALVSPFPSGGTKAGSGERMSVADHAHRAYAVGLVGRAARPPLVSNIVAAIVLARAIENGTMPFARIVRAAVMSAPVVSLHAPISGFEQAMRRLIEVPGFIPGGALNGIDGDYVYDDSSFVGSESIGRTYIQFIGDNVRRVSGTALQRRLVNALTRDYPVVAISEKSECIPSEIAIAADIDLCQ